VQGVFDSNHAGWSEDEFPSAACNPEKIFAGLRFYQVELHFLQKEKGGLKSRKIKINTHPPIPISGEDRPAPQGDAADREMAALNEKTLPQVSRERVFSFSVSW
jgi:hypothetical protein